MAISTDIQKMKPIALLGGARGRSLNYFFILIIKSGNHFGLSINSTMSIQIILQSCQKELSLLLNYFYRLACHDNFLIGIENKCFNLRIF